MPWKYFGPKHFSQYKASLLKASSQLCEFFFWVFTNTASILDICSIMHLNTTVCCTLPTSEKFLPCSKLHCQNLQIYWLSQLHNHTHDLVLSLKKKEHWSYLSDLALQNRHFLVEEMSKSKSETKGQTHPTQLTYHEPKNEVVEVFKNLLPTHHSYYMSQG